MRKLLAAVAGALLLAGCAVGPDYEQPALDLPAEWPEHVLLSDEDRAAWQQWWTRFDDPVLDRLVARALDDNLDIRLEAQRILEARAQLGLADANQYPTVEGQAQAARENQPRTTAAVPGAAGPGNLFSVTGTLAYEVDLWGRLARQEEAAGARLRESVFSRDAVRLNVVADVVATYFDLRAAQRQLTITERTLESRERTYDLEKARYEAGETDALALRQAESELETTRARIPPLRERVRTLESALAVLVGMSPAELLEQLDFAEGSLVDVRLPEDVPSVLPSELLQRRPDIRAAEAALIAANAEIGVAEASRLPSLNLTAFLGSTATATDDLFTAPAETWGVGASLLGPILDFGRNAARVDTAQARRAQAETQYRMTVTNAFREVRDALVLYETTQERVEAVERQVAAIEETRRIAQVRYDEGLTSFIELLDAQRALLDAELALAEAKRDRLSATATLFKAMGGGWSEAERQSAAEGQR
ncbi:efflux transporter outer membrane subunit [Aquisalimonas lutea]|uniref:efflux transporter outer membrane subunit n=1 Tax=Aquisalimonas lutea TaxID=1327750 RepID=UPI0025B56DA2|nr:efflux transporter outer membrane subunit [Aquisalimonas lutea]MDN3515982.1 efflux transporter outer membrane subunit [Aquisalimonas lutea]